MSASDPIRILVVCTGNICRSPMAEVLLRSQLADTPLDVAVSSAGFIRDGMEPPPAAHAVMGERGLSLDHHLSRVVTPGLVSEADLIVAMERLHVRNIVAEEPPSFARTFTFEELIRRGADVGPVGTRSLPTWLEEMGADREPTQYLGSSKADDVPDPMGRSKRVFRRTAARLEILSSGLTDLLMARAD